MGITRFKGRLTHEDVDFRGNLNLLREAGKSRVGKFGFISPAGTPEGRREAPLLAAKHRFETALRASEVPWVSACSPPSSRPNWVADGWPSSETSRSAVSSITWPAVNAG